MRPGDTRSQPPSETRRHPAKERIASTLAQTLRCRLHPEHERPEKEILPLVVVPDLPVEAAVGVPPPVRGLRQAGARGLLKTCLENSWIDGWVARGEGAPRRSRTSPPRAAGATTTDLSARLTIAHRPVAFAPGPLGAPGSTGAAARKRAEKRWCVRPAPQGPGPTSGRRRDRPRPPWGKKSRGRPPARAIRSGSLQLCRLSD